MALTLTERYTLSQNSTFRGQIQAQISKQAVTTIQSVPDPTKALTRANKLKQLAQAILSSPSSYTDAFAGACAYNCSFVSPTVATDAEIVTAVTQAFPFVAGLDSTEQ